MANVKTGFSKPYVAIYSNSGNTISYSNGQILARGVSVDLSVNSADAVNFYADNIIAESAGGIFTDGEITLTVDGLDAAAEKLIYNLDDAGADGFVSWGDANPATVGLGFIVRTMYLGVESYQRIIIPKARFNTPSLNAATQEETIAFQTTELTAVLMRDDSDGHYWIKKGTLRTTETAAENDIKTIFNI